MAKTIGDIALVGAGVAMAVGSIVFAAAMFGQDDHAPRINGMQYLAIFAKPRGASHPTIAEAPVVTATPPVVADAAVDMAPTGSVARRALDMAPTGSIVRGAASESSAPISYRIIAVEPGMAWLSDGPEIRVVKPGDVAPGLGRIASIEQREGRWLLIDESGATLLSSDSPVAKDFGDGDGPFARRMIFGGD
ncbi:MAG: hypothetical protein ABSC22_18370 [Roseiarcus sp.]|jgi:hypothetical protein